MKTKKTLLDNWKQDRSVAGSSGNDIVTGEGGNDEIIGAAGDDILLGGSGNDKLIADSGSDIIYGGTGTDEFIIEKSDTETSESMDTSTESIVTIMDIDAHDTINLNSFDAITSFDTLTKETLQLSDGTYTMIQTDSNHQVLIKGISADQLTTDMFSGAATNLAPIITNETASVSVNEDETIEIDILQYATDANGDELFINQIMDGHHGVIEVVDGKWVYTPNENFNGTDTIKYEVKDSWGAIANGSLSINVIPINDAPTADIDHAWVREDGWRYLAVTAWADDVDGDALSIETFTQAQHGMVEQFNGSLRYKPNAHFNGTDEFSYTITDGNGGSITKTVTIDVDAREDEIKIKKGVKHIVAKTDKENNTNS